MARTPSARSSSRPIGTRRTTLLWYLAGPGRADRWNESRPVYGMPFGNLVTEILDGIRDGAIAIPQGTADVYLRSSRQTTPTPTA